MVALAARRVDGIGSEVPVHPVLFALYPVLHLYATNAGEVAAADVLAPLLLVVGLTVLGQGLLTIILRDGRRAAIAATSVVVPVMLFGLLLEIAEPLVGDDERLLLAICVVGVGVAVVGSLRMGSRLGQLTLGLNAIGLVLVLLTLVPVARGMAAVDAPADDRVVRAPAAELPEGLATRDIYHLILDRYGSEPSLRTGFGIDNSGFTDWLRDQGFQVIDDARANYTRTTRSLASTLGMSLLDSLVERMGPDAGNYAPLTRQVERSRAGAALQRLGYEYVHIGSWYNPTRDSRIADRSYSPETEVTFATTLYDGTVLPVLVALPQQTDDFPRKHADSAEYQLDLLEVLVREPGRKYVFAHILLPHDPYVFLPDGTFAPEPADFASQLAYTNARLQALIAMLLVRPEAERPIIIVQGDEGPFPPRYADDEDGFDWSTATDEELVTKFGILNALYLPGPEGAAPLPDGLTPVNTYPEILARYFGSEVSRQPDRTYASNRARPYDQLDVTERLEALIAAGEGPAGG
ncbi:hypothetical protein BH23CHL8_BH23CHL8_28090 [soil metagenome]